ncbi:Disease resistance protein (CC-NBS-LRR class) family [Euphorbia peplus]|nr:Disease resistance protein (CC-NBS-LRR class) family [Euphorbia peplus]
MEETLQTLTTVLEKLSNLLIQESDFLLGVELYIKKIENMLRPRLLEQDHDKKISNELIHNIEDAISELMITSDNKWKKHVFLLYVMAFGVQTKDLFFVMLVMQLIDQVKLIFKWSNIYNQIWSGSIFSYGVPKPLSGAFERNSDWLSVKNTIIFGTIMQFEALAEEKQLSPAVKSDVLWLCDNFKAFQEFLKDVVMEKLSKDDMAWVDEVFDVCCSANNVVSSFLGPIQKQGKKNGKGPLKKMIMAVPNLISKHKLTAKLLRIKDHVQDISDRKPQLLPTPISSSNNIRSLPLASAAEQLDIVSFDEDVQVITEKLLIEDTRCITISILGVAGIGKTSLAKLVYTNEAIVHHFPLRLWVSGTSEVDIIAKILAVGRCLNDSEIVRMVNTVFADKRFLIVVDDSCARNFWEKMGGAFRNLFNGSRIIFTVCKPKEAPPFSETNFNYRLHLRSDDESWAMFKHTLKLNISLKLEKDLKKQILRKCGGLPKAIVNLVGLLSKREATRQEWSRVLDQLNQDEEPWQQIQKNINGYLPLYLRRCLFYFGLFPADYMIPARRLINLWVAEGFVWRRQYERSAESVAEEFLEVLENYNMVQVTERKLNGKIKTCRLPEALRVYWLAKAKETNFLQGHSNTTLGIRRLADHLNPDDAIFEHIHGKKSTNMYPSYRNSVSFISFDSREDAGSVIGNFLERRISENCFFYLLVLDLETVYRPILPKALSKLTHLRYLGLRSTYLERLPMFIEKLLSLQTLDLKRTCVSTLPRSIWKMQKLRHLFLDQSFRTIFPPRLEESFLEELQTIWGLFIDENSPVKNGLDTLSNITKLGLKSKVSVQSQNDAMSSQLEAVENWVMNLKCLEKLRLKSFDESEQPWDLHLESLSDHTHLSSVYLVGKLKNQQLVSKFPQNLIELTLSASGLEDDPMQTLDKLPELKILRLYSKAFSGTRMFCSSGGFPKLQMLKLWELENLEAWDMEEGSLPHLKDLEIRRCMNFKILPEALQYVKTLRKVKLTKLPLLSPKIRDINGDYRNRIGHVLDVCIED